MEWISVDDRLPDKYDVYLAWGKGLSDVPETMFFRNAEWLWTDDETLSTGVTHWMPLPEPPNSKGGE